MTPLSLLIWTACLCGAVCCVALTGYFVHWLAFAVSNLRKETAPKTFNVQEEVAILAHATPEECRGKLGKVTWRNPEDLYKVQFGDASSEWFRADELMKVRK